MDAVTKGVVGKAHRKQRAGPKAEKRKLADKKKKGVSTEKNNPKVCLHAICKIKCISTPLFISTIARFICVRRR